MDQAIFAIMYILVFSALVAGSMIVGEIILRIALHFSPRLRRFFDELPMNREE